MLTLKLETDTGSLEGKVEALADWNPAYPFWGLFDPYSVSFLKCFFRYI